MTMSDDENDQEIDYGLEDEFFNAFQSTLGKDVEDDNIEQDTQQKYDEEALIPKFDKNVNQLVKQVQISDDKSIADTKIDFIVEKLTCIRLTKSPYRSENDLQTRLTCEFGKFYKFHELWRRVSELKGNKDQEWFTIGILGTKLDTKTSAKGNSYVIWHMFDINNLEKEFEISLFLFGGAYKKYWKSSEYSVFAIRKPEFLDDSKSQAAKPAAHKYSKTGKVNQKVTLSIVNENQLEFLGNAKDVTTCQAFKRQQVGSNENAFESGQRCKNLVNLSESKVCLFHCKKASKSGKKGEEERGRFSMIKPENPVQSSPSIFLSKHIDNLPAKALNSAKNDKNSDYQKRIIKEQNIMSLTYNQYDSPLLKSKVFKADRVSDNFLLAKLANKDDEELKRLRAEKVTYKEEDLQSKKEIKSLLSSKALLPKESDAHTSVSCARLLEMKKNMLKEQTVTNLSTMYSHRDIVKEIKKNSEQEEVPSDAIIEESKSQKVTSQAISSKIGAFAFLKERFNELNSSTSSGVKQSPQTPKVLRKKDDFDDLEIFDGDSKTSKKLFNLSHIQMENPRSPLILKKPAQQTATPTQSLSKKRKLEESFEEEKAAKLNKIENLLNVKSTHLNDANDPDKNPHLKNYLNKLEEKEKAENQLSSCKSIEVRVVTCTLCDYTTFRQSDLCKEKGHQVRRHLAKQRFFKCKSCSKRTYTLDRPCPISACEKCGHEKYESCAMRDDNVQTSITGDKLQTHSI